MRQTPNNENALNAKQFGDSREEGETVTQRKETIMHNFTRKIDEGVETYAFPSAIRLDQKHFIQRTDGTPWSICLVDTTPNLTLEQGITLLAELEHLCDFVVKLNGKELRRRTEPGPPAFEEII